MRVEPDRQGGNYSSEAPACHRCGVPLLEETTFCPYCERWLDDGSEQPRGTRRAERGGAAGIAARVTEKALLTAGFVFFALVAAVCLVAAFLI